MSWDFIQDAIDSLNQDNCQYILIVGKEGHSKTDLFHAVNTRKDAEEFKKTLNDFIEANFPKE